MPTYAPSTAEVLRGAVGSIRPRADLWVSNAAGDYVRRLPGVDNIAITLDNRRDWHWEGAITMQHTDTFDPVKDWVRVSMDLWHSDHWERHDLGHYRLWVPNEAALAWQRTWTLTAFSGEWMLAGTHARRHTIDPRIQGYHVPPGSWCLEQAALIVTGIFGVPKRLVRFPPRADDRQLTKGMLFDVVQDPEGSYWLGIVNALCNAAGHYPAFTTGSGVWRTKERRPLTAEEATFKLGTGEGYENLVDGDEPFQITRDWANFANEIIVVSNDVNQIPPVCAVVQATNRENPYSIPEIGYTKSATLSLQQIVGPAEAQRIGKNELSRRVAVQEEYGFQTVCDPRRGPHEIYDLNYLMRDGSKIVKGRYFVQGFGMQVKPFGLMDHRVGKVLPIEEGDEAA